MLRRLVAALLTLSIGVAAYAYPPLNCKYDGIGLYFTGKTRVVWGVMEYQCSCGTHRYWLNAADCSE